MTIAAKYEDGVFKPLEDVKLAEGTRVEVHIPADARGGQSQSASLRPSGCGPIAMTSPTA
jgi:predicted DNA-binding antitoxin AbrB/MazE fold protein